jgi:hypothetical protein
MVEREARGVFVPVSKIRGRGFSIRSSVRAGERAWSILGHVDKDLRAGPN